MNNLTESLYEKYNLTEANSLSSYFPKFTINGWKEDKNYFLSILGRNDIHDKIQKMVFGNTIELNDNTFSISLVDEYGHEYIPYDICEDFNINVDEMIDFILQSKLNESYNSKQVNEEYGEDKYSLVGQDGNAFALMGYTARCMKECGLRDEIDEMRERATESDYNNLIRVCDEYVQRCNDIARDGFEEALNEDFWNPGEEFTEFNNLLNTEFDERNWNNWNQDERDAFAKKVAKRYLEINPNPSRAFFDDLEDSNFHTYYRAFDILLNDLPDKYVVLKDGKIDTETPWREYAESHIDIQSKQDGSKYELKGLKDGKLIDLEESLNEDWREIPDEVFNEMTVYIDYLLRGFIRNNITPDKIADYIDGYDISWARDEYDISREIWQEDLDPLIEAIMIALCANHTEEER